MIDDYDVVVVGSGNAGMSAAIAAIESCDRVIVIEKGDYSEYAGNTAYSAGAMRCALDTEMSIVSLIASFEDERIYNTQFPMYPHEEFLEELASYNNGLAPTPNQRILVQDSYEALLWLVSKGVRFEPNYEAQSVKVGDEYRFWGGSILRTVGEGAGLAEAQRANFLSNGGEFEFKCAAKDLTFENERLDGLLIEDSNESIRKIKTSSVVLASGGFGSSKEMLSSFVRADVSRVAPRGTKNNTGDGLRIAFSSGATAFGLYDGCHIVPMGIPRRDATTSYQTKAQRLRTRKVCYHLGLMLNVNGLRFVDEGHDFRNHTYARYGRAIIEQDQGLAYQFFDGKVVPFLYDEYHTKEENYIESDDLLNLIDRIHPLDKLQALETIQAYNQAVSDEIAFDASVKDGKKADGLIPPRSNWAQRLDTPPYRAYPVTGGITFTYGGVEIDDQSCVIREDGSQIPGLFACGEMVGGVFYNGYPSGSGLTSGTVFGRRAGYSAARHAIKNGVRHGHELHLKRI